MPILEFECKKCGRKFEEIVLSLGKVKDETECSKCGGLVERQKFPSRHGFNATDLARARL